VREQPKFPYPTTGFPAKWRLRNKRRNPILMMPNYPDVGSASDCLKQMSLATWLIRSTTQIWVVTRHQCGISAVVYQMSHVFGGINQCSAVVVKYRLFSVVFAFSLYDTCMHFPGCTIRSRCLSYIAIGVRSFEYESIQTGEQTSRVGPTLLSQGASVQ